MKKHRSFGDFIDLIDKDDSRLFGSLDSFLGSFVHIDELCRFFIRQHFSRFPDRKLAALFLFGIRLLSASCMFMPICSIPEPWSISNMDGCCSSTSTVT